MVETPKFILRCITYSVIPAIHFHSSQIVFSSVQNANSTNSIDFLKTSARKTLIALFANHPNACIVTQVIRKKQSLFSNKVDYFNVFFSQQIYAT